MNSCLSYVVFRYIVYVLYKSKIRQIIKRFLVPVTATAFTASWMVHLLLMCLLLPLLYPHPSHPSQHICLRIPLRIK